MNSIDNLIEKWSDLRFIDSCPNKRNGAIGCELLANTLIKGEYDQRLNVLMFPVVVRVIREYNEDIEIGTIKSMVDELIVGFPLDELKVVEQSEKAELLGDIEAIMVCKYADNYLAQRN